VLGDGACPYFREDLVSSNQSTLLNHSALAFLPGLKDGVLEDALGIPVRSCTKIGEFLAALENGETTRPERILFLTLDHPAVDPTLARRIADESGGAPLFLTSSTSSVARILQAERVGATALLPHPPDRDSLRREVLPLIAEVGAIEVPAEKVPGGSPSEDQPIVGSSSPLLDVFRVVARAADSASPVLITGESGTGKEVVARALHSEGGRRAAPFIAVNCAAIPDTLLEAELFGYEKGAFSGAVARSECRFGRADKGTLFLDEIGEMSLSLQAKLLRVLESGEIERLGSRETVRVDTRIVAATNRDLRERVVDGRFREDLLFRLAVVELEIPPLRHRQEDVGALLLHFVARFSLQHGRPVRALSQAAWEKLLHYLWPGNVRELRNVVDRAVLLARGGVIRSGDLRMGAEAPHTSPIDGETGPGYPPTLSLREVEEAHIRAVLRHTDGKMGEAAEILRIHRNTMTMKVREYGIDPASPADGSEGRG
jgi:DNA-binding NtrC family response regulator